jgi:CHASE3 domain sensor protein
MPRPTRKQLKFDEDSVNKLLQEIYDESHNIKAKIARLFTKWEQRVKENGEIQAIGDQIVKLIAAEAKNQDQKIMLLKYLKEVVFENKNESSDTGKTSGDAKETVSADRRSELLSMVQKELDKKEQEKRNNK